MLSNSTNSSSSNKPRPSASRLNPVLLGAGLATEHRGGAGCSLRRRRRRQEKNKVTQRKVMRLKMADLTPHCQGKDGVCVYERERERKREGGKREEIRERGGKREEIRERGGEREGGREKGAPILSPSSISIGVYKYMYILHFHFSPECMRERERGRERGTPILVVYIF